MVAPRTLGVGVVGFGWMGQVHSRAYERVLHHYPSLGVRPELVCVADPEPDRRRDARARFGFLADTASWEDLIADDRIEAVSVTAPNFLHAQIGSAVAAAGKHLWIEKPVGLDSADTRAVAEAVAAAGVRSAVGFNYRNAPAVQHARELLATGALGRVTNVHVRMDSDYAAHPSGALSWRFQRALGGNGVLGDLVSHGVDLARHVVGQIDELVADAATLIPRRPRPTGAGTHFDIAEGGELGDVENADYLGCLVRFAGGARGTITSSRVSVGDQNAYGFTVHGTAGQLSWDHRRMGELQIGVGGEHLDQPMSTVLVGPRHGEFAAFQPGAGNAMGYDDLKVIEAQRFLTSIVDDRPVGATILDALAMARVLDAMGESAASGRWVSLPTHD